MKTVSQLLLHGESSMNYSQFSSFIKSASIVSCFSVASTAALAQATFLIWPIYPNIEAHENATAVWLENTGKSDAMVQIRVFKWDQKDAKDSYQVQNEVIPSPPVVRIKASEKNMLRLTRAVMPAERQESAYRIIIDELPIKSEGEGQDTAQVAFQMRYSIPLFSYGKGIGSGLNTESVKLNGKNLQAKPILSFWTTHNNGQYELHIKNEGHKYARLSGLQVSPSGSNIAGKDLSVGYILAQSQMRYEIDSKLASQLNAVQAIYSMESSMSSTKPIEIRRVGP